MTHQCFFHRRQLPETFHQSVRGCFQAIPAKSRDCCGELCKYYTSASNLPHASPFFMEPDHTMKIYQISLLTSIPRYFKYSSFYVFLNKDVSANKGIKPLHI